MSTTHDEYEALGFVEFTSAVQYTFELGNPKLVPQQAIQVLQKQKRSYRIRVSPVRLLDVLWSASHADLPEIKGVRCILVDRYRLDLIASKGKDLNGFRALQRREYN